MRSDVPRRRLLLHQTIPDQERVPNRVCKDCQARTRPGTTEASGPIDVIPVAKRSGVASDGATPEALRPCVLPVAASWKRAKQSPPIVVACPRVTARVAEGSDSGVNNVATAAMHVDGGEGCWRVAGYRHEFICIHGGFDRRASFAAGPACVTLT